MAKKRKIDFVLNDNEFERLIFRFYPRQSSCHSFNEKPPKSWKEVYKVYYSYSIIKQYKDDGNVELSVVLFDSGCDECSVIDSVAARIKLIIDGAKSVTRTWGDEEFTINLFDEVQPAGQGVFWKINEYLNYQDETVYRVEMFDWDNVGYRLYLDREELKKFGEYLEYCCEYMLKHGDPI